MAVPEQIRKLTGVIGKRGKEKTEAIRKTLPPKSPNNVNTR